MKRAVLIPSLAVALTFLLTGCSSSFWGGTAAGVAGTGAGYEIHADREMKRIDEDLKSGKIDQREYDIRKDQIRRDSVFK
jgi:hypothetical protein